MGSLTAELPATHVPRARGRLGIPLPLAWTDAELRRAIPPAAVQMLDAARSQIVSTIFVPLLHAPSIPDLMATFVDLYPRFTLLYYAASLATWAVAEPEEGTTRAMAIRSFEKLQDIVRTQGPQWLGDDATSATLLGLHAMTGIAAALAKGGEFEEVRAADVSRSVIGHMMALGAINIAVAADEGQRGRRECAIQLAFWSKGYALRAWGVLSHALTVARQHRPEGKRLPEGSADEDYILANAALEEYLRVADGKG
jgi:hypothetical protein